MKYRPVFANCLGRGPFGLAASLAAAALALALSTGCASWVVPPKQPLVDEVAVQPFVVDPIEVAGAPPAEGWFTKLLDTTATAAAERSVLERQLSTRVSVGGVSGGYRLSGIVRVPASLPPEIAGATALFRKGELASAHIELTGPDGTSDRSVDVTLQWKDADWSTGSRYFRRARRQDVVLTEVVERIVERGILELVRQMTAETRRRE